MSFEFSKDEIIKGKYCFEEDEEQLTKYNNYVTGDNKSKDKMKYKDDYLYHLEVLPQPFFGNINNPKILVLAKNPSYDEYGDKIDTIVYLKTNDYICDKYIEHLKIVDFTKEIDRDKYTRVLNKNEVFNDADINYCYYCAWNWWKSNVFDGVELSDKYKNELCILNLNGYHSKYYNAVKDNGNIGKDALKNLLKNFKEVELVIVVWGKDLWNEVIQSIDNQKLKETFNNSIVLNKGINISPLKEKLDEIKDWNKYFKIKMRDN